MIILQKLRFIWMYLGNPPWDTNISPPELLHIIDTVSPGHALDIGCGTATNAIKLAENGWTVTGIDFIHRPIQIARKKARQAKVSVDLKVADVTNLVLYEKYDLILDMGCFHNLSKPGRDKYTRSINEWLKPNGLFLLYGFLKPEDSHSPRGIDLSDISNFESYLFLKDQQNGLDRRRKSGWYIFQKAVDHQI